jgi:hypothetical protein
VILAAAAKAAAIGANSRLSSSSARSPGTSKRWVPRTPIRARISSIGPRVASPDQHRGDVAQGGVAERAGDQALARVGGVEEDRHRRMKVAGRDRGRDPEARDAAPVDADHEPELAERDRAALDRRGAGHVGREERAAGGEHGGHVEDLRLLLDRDGHSAGEEEAGLAVGEHDAELVFEGPAVDLAAAAEVHARIARLRADLDRDVQRAAQAEQAGEQLLLAAAAVDRPRGVDVEAGQHAAGPRQLDVAAGQGRLVEAGQLGEGEGRVVERGGDDEEALQGDELLERGERAEAREGGEGLGLDGEAERVARDAGGLAGDEREGAEPLDRGGRREHAGLAVAGDDDGEGVDVEVEARGRGAELVAQHGDQGAEPELAEHAAQVEVTGEGAAHAELEVVADPRDPGEGAGGRRALADREVEGEVLEAEPELADLEGPGLVAGEAHRHLEPAGAEGEEQRIDGQGRGSEAAGREALDQAVEGDRHAVFEERVEAIVVAAAGDHAQRDAVELEGAHDVDRHAGGGGRGADDEADGEVADLQVAPDVPRDAGQADGDQELVEGEGAGAGLDDAPELGEREVAERGHELRDLVGESGREVAAAGEAGELGEAAQGDAVAAGAQVDLRVIPFELGDRGEGDPGAGDGDGAGAGDARLERGVLTEPGARVRGVDLQCAVAKLEAAEAEADAERGAQGDPRGVVAVPRALVGDQRRGHVGRRGDPQGAAERERGGRAEAGLEHAERALRLHLRDQVEARDELVAGARGEHEVGIEEVQRFEVGCLGGQDRGGVDLAGHRRRVVPYARQVGERAPEGPGARGRGQVAQLVAKLHLDAAVVGEPEAGEHRQVGGAEQRCAAADDDDAVDAVVGPGRRVAQLERRGRIMDVPEFADPAGEGGAREGQHAALGGEGGSKLGVVHTAFQTRRYFGEVAAVTCFLFSPSRVISWPFWGLKHCATAWV